MPIRPILSLPDPRLRLISKPVETVTPEIRTLLDDMLETMYDAPGIGIATIQIGIGLRVVTIDLSKKEGEPKRPFFILNPEIVWRSPETRPYEEGCLSIPDYYEHVERPVRVHVQYMDREGRPQMMEADGLLATAIQHEIDHLDGVLFIDHISRLKRNRIIKKFTKAASRRDGYAGDDSAE